MNRLRWAHLTVSLCLTACHCTFEEPPDGGDGGTPPGDGGMLVHCPADLNRYIDNSGSGTAQLRAVTQAADLIGGPTAHGKVGDYLLSNDKIRVIVQGKDRHIGPQPFGGTIIDADLVRAGAGQDQLGEVGLFYNFGRTLDPQQLEILNDGSDGSAAVLAITGPDTANDFISLRNQFRDTLGQSPAADPYTKVPLLVTNYFVLNPGEQRLRFITAFCNLSNTAVQTLAVGDLVDPGYLLELFNPQACTGGFGYGGSCFGIDRMPWFGYLGQGVAYGYAPYSVGLGLTPESQNATMSVAGITGSIVGAPGLPGLLSWFNPNAGTRDGELRLTPRGAGVLVRDFWVGKDLADLSSLIETSRSRLTTARPGNVAGTVTEAGQPVAGARVAFTTSSGVASVATTDAAGHYTVALAVKTYSVSAWALGHLPSPEQMVSVIADTTVPADFTLTPPRHLTVNVREANGGAMPAKVTVMCESGQCPVTQAMLVKYQDTPKDPINPTVQLLDFVPASGTATFALPPARYQVWVSRGPEYSLHPNNGVPQTVDLRAADGTVNAVLARVLDTQGYLSADFHVHAVNSPDSIVDNATRALSFAADGVEVMVATDHDYVTDYSAVIAQTGLTPFLATIAGEEASPMDFGHYNLFPINRDPADAINGGAVDWAGADSATLSPRLIFEAAKTRGAKTVQFNHPRGNLGGLTWLKADTDTFATHADPAQFRMAPAPDATADNTQLLGYGFNAMEVLNSGEDLFDVTSVAAKARFNDWFTLLSRGFRVTGTGTSDTHSRALATGWRTFVRVGQDNPAAMNTDTLTTALNANQALATNGPFVVVSVSRVEANGAPVGTAATMGEVLGPDTRGLGVTVDIQVPEYLDITRVELYMHRPQDDATCPIAPSNPRASTTRVACNGLANSNWPASGITASADVALTAGDLENVTQDSGVTYRRYRKRVTFRLPAPTEDNWLVAFVYGNKSVFPLNDAWPDMLGNFRRVIPFALTNPVFIDADGNGYDKPPFKP
ncbi:MAG: CehA/McbA family metallohydrolase [Myxococcaceae bacterium]|nr:CehA/McbA family metallohydrolase [Myxococcaceae bacterium]